ncbi:MAG: hypothetical protein JXR77_01875 [Lentisphaeria bacterium]|nr:hypothetical protein [Lentisphaeria bacterium]
MKALALVAFVLVPALAGEEFATLRPTAGGVHREALATIFFDRDVYGATRDAFPDVRVLTAEGQAVPFRLDLHRELRTAFSERFAKGNVRQLTAAADNRLEVLLAPPDPELSGVEDTPPWCLEVLTPLTDFEKSVSVSVQRAGQWEPLVEEQTLYDYRRFMDVRSCRILLPEAPAADLYRVVVRDVTDADASAFVELTRRSGGGALDQETIRSVLRKRDFRIDAIRFGYRVRRDRETAPATREYPLHILEKTEDPEAKTTVLTVACDRLPVREIVFHTDSRNFSRTVTVETREADADGVVLWRRLGSGNIRVLRFREIQEALLSVPLRESRPEALRITVENRDSPPIGIAGVTGVCSVHRVLFLAEPEVAYLLAYGSAKAGAPRYDAEVLGRLAALAEGETTVLELAPVGERTPTPGPGPLARLFESKLTIGAAIALVLAVLGYAMLRALRGMDRAGTGPGDA